MSIKEKVLSTFRQIYLVGARKVIQLNRNGKNNKIINMEKGDLQLAMEV